MPMTEEDVKKSLLRTIDCLQRLYALLLALATNELLKRFMERTDKTVHPVYHWVWLPDVLTFVVTLVPVYHGMHRHLDRAYSTPVKDKDRTSLRWFFAADALLTLFTFGLFFVLQLNVGEPDFPLYFVGILAVNAIWGVISDSAPNSKIIMPWFVLNSVGCIVAAMIAFAHPEDLAEPVKRWLVAAVAVARTVLDYGLSWDVFFPPKP